jgi:hypothetical protein
LSHDPIKIKIEMGNLINLFDKRPETIWKQFSKEIDAEFHPGQFDNSDSVVINSEKWKITFDTYTALTVSGGQSYEKDYTRIRAPFISRDNLKFLIYHQGLISVLGKLFGAQDIVIGYPVFDKAYVIKGNNENKIRLLFSNSRIRELISMQRKMHLEIIDTEGNFGEIIPPGICELYYVIEGYIKNIKELKSLYLLYVTILDELTKIGSAIP